MVSKGSRCTMRSGCVGITFIAILVWCVLLRAALRAPAARPFLYAVSHAESMSRCHWRFVRAPDVVSQHRRDPPILVPVCRTASGRKPFYRLHSWPPNFSDCDVQPPLDMGYIAPLVTESWLKGVDNWPSRRFQPQRQWKLEAQRDSSGAEFLCKNRSAIVTVALGQLFAGAAFGSVVDTLAASFHIHAFPCDHLIIIRETCGDFVEDFGDTPRRVLCVPIASVNTSISAQRQKAPEVARAAYVAEWLQSSWTRYDFVVLIDARDVLFGGDPFAPLYESSVSGLFAVEETWSMADPVGWFSRSWLHRIFADDERQNWLNSVRLGGRPFPVLCSGLYGGTASAMLDFTYALSQAAIDAEANGTVLVRGMDQGLFIHLVTVMLPYRSFPHSIDVFDSAVGPYTNNIRSGTWILNQSAVPLRLPKIDDGTKLEYSSFLMRRSTSGSQDVRLWSVTGALLNCNMQPYALMHQLDRQWSIFREMAELARRFPPEHWGSKCNNDQAVSIAVRRRDVLRGVWRHILSVSSEWVNPILQCSVADLQHSSGVLSRIRRVSCASMNAMVVIASTIDLGHLHRLVHRITRANGPCTDVFIVLPVPSPHFAVHAVDVLTPLMKVSETVQLILSDHNSTCAKCRVGLAASVSRQLMQLEYRKLCVLLTTCPKAACTSCELDAWSIAANGNVFSALASSVAPITFAFVPIPASAVAMKSREIRLCMSSVGFADPDAIGAAVDAASQTMPNGAAVSPSFLAGNAREVAEYLEVAATLMFARRCPASSALLSEFLPIVATAAAGSHALSVTAAAYWLDRSIFLSARGSSTLRTPCLTEASTNATIGFIFGLENVPPAWELHWGAHVVLFIEDSVVAQQAKRDGVLAAFANSTWLPRMPFVGLLPDGTRAFGPPPFNSLWEWAP